MLKAKELEDIQHAYQLGNQLKYIDTIHAGDVNEAYVLSDGKQKFAIKKINKQKYVNDYQIELTQLMRSMSFSENIAEQMSFTNHTTAALKADNEYLLQSRSHFFLLYPYIDANELQNKDIDACQVQKIAKFLYQIHHSSLHYDEQFALEKLQAFKTLALQVLNHKIWPMLKTFSHQSLFLPKINYVSNFLLNNYQSFKRSIEGLDGQVICHNDLKPKNVLWKNERFWVVDWETAGLFDKMSDYIDTLLSWCSDYDGHGFKLDEHKIQAFLKEYPTPDCQEIKLSLHIVLLKWYFWLGFCLNKLKQNPIKYRGYLFHIRYATHLIIFITHHEKALSDRFSIK